MDSTNPDLSEFAARSDLVPGTHELKPPPDR
jgi:hypothetical protein